MLVAVQYVYPIYGHMFFGHASAIFGSIGLKFLMVTQETILSIDWWREIRDLIFFVDFDFLGQKFGSLWSILVLGKLTFVS